ncbi:MAG: hypothetical protein ABIV05_00450 [Actinomycetota bacterium]
MTYAVERTSARAWTDAQMGALFAEGFPPFITADQEVKRYIGHVREHFPHLDIMLVDADGEPAATGWGVPLAWSGQADDLPSSFADVLRLAVEAHESAASPDTFVIAGGVVRPVRKGTGAAAELVRALVRTGTDGGLTRVVAPVRPTRKHLYPLTPIGEYATWTRHDGEPFDPWLRLHHRLGGTVVALAPAAQTMTGSVAEWQDWTGLRLPASGDYVIPSGMSVLSIDFDADLGTYVEPNVWVRHR